MPTYRNVALTNTALHVGSAPVLEAYDLYNPTGAGAAAYVHLYNELAVNVNVGTTVPKVTLAVEAGARVALSRIDEAFSKAMTIAATSTAAGSAAPGSAVVANIFYR